MIAGSVDLNNITKAIINNDLIFGTGFAVGTL